MRLPHCFCATAAAATPRQSMGSLLENARYSLGNRRTPLVTPSIGGSRRSRRRAQCSMEVDVESPSASVHRKAIRSFRSAVRVLALLAVELCSRRTHKVECNLETRDRFLQCIRIAISQVWRFSSLFFFRGCTVVSHVRMSAAHQDQHKEARC